jgi:UDP:flavonoid glycosyltransferase YjiC (YdhE family)
MRILALTFDAGGNLPPLLGLIEALLARGHGVDVMGHDTQRRRIEAAGAGFIAFETASQRNAADPDPNMLAWLEAFDPVARDEFLSAAEARAPDALIIDPMLPAALAGANASPWPTVALAHAPYSLLSEMLGGRFRAPMDGADVVLVLSFEAFDGGPPAPANIVFTDPARPSAVSNWSRRLLDKKLILASLSTAQQNQEPVLRRLCEALTQVDAEVLVTSGRAIDPASLPRAPHMTIERAVPHEAVLPFADLLVTHAGHGTVMAALRAGAPMLCLPGVGDQPSNARRVTAMGLGEVIDTGSALEVLRAAIERLLADDALRERCRAFAQAAAEAPGLDLAIERIEALAAARR